MKIRQWIYAQPMHDSVLEPSRLPAGTRRRVAVGRGDGRFRHAGHDRLLRHALDELSRLLSEGAIRPVRRMVDGFEQLPAAISSLYRMPRFGKLQVRFVAD